MIIRNRLFWLHVGYQINWDARGFTLMALPRPEDARGIRAEVPCLFRLQVTYFWRVWPGITLPRFQWEFARRVGG